jgi:hypothetical protein
MDSRISLPIQDAAAHIRPGKCFFCYAGTLNFGRLPASTVKKPFSEKETHVYRGF